MKMTIFLMMFGSIFYSSDLFAQTATDVVCTGCVGETDLATSAVTGQKIKNGAVNSAKIYDGAITNADISSAAAIDASKISGTAWTSTNDGSGTGLDADTVDGIEASEFLRTDVSGTIAGDLTATGNLSGTGVCIGVDCRSTWPADGEGSP